MSLFFKRSNPPRWLIIFCLIFAGELIFGLPFHIARFFRPTLLAVFELNNAQLGDAFSVYGITAMLSYFPSGIISDRFSNRKLMSFSLAATALGGMVLLTIPGQFVLSVLFGFWGVTTILLFWSALMKSTREWGGRLAQGRAFGLLDGGRGLVAAALATIGVFLLSHFLSDNVEGISESAKRSGLEAIILYYTLLTFGISVLVWFVIPESKLDKVGTKPFVGIRQVLQRRTTWMQATVIVCAYCGYKGLDYYAQYAMEVLNISEVEASRFVSNASYIRPFAAIGAGFLADRFTTKRSLILIFILAISGYILLGLSDSSNSFPTIMGVNILITFAAVYALRGVYFALFEETNVPANLTGTTIGIVSLVGFTPDVFFHSLAGRILDNSPGLEGFQKFYLLLLLFSLVGLTATILLNTKSMKH